MRRGYESGDRSASELVPPPASVTIPNPGSDEAGELGCICAVMDNNHGKWVPWPPDGWWITAGCPVHMPAVDE